jgi:hypothetical protein
VLCGQLTALLNVECIETWFLLRRLVGVILGLRKVEVMDIASTFLRE